MQPGRRRALLALLLALAAPPSARAQFDWGSGCEGGEGAPFSVGLAEGATRIVGTIPPGKYAVQILLDSATDVDVQLFDGDEPLISWCEKKPKTRSLQVSRGCGLLPSDPDTATGEKVAFRGMVITYSGYGGVVGASGANPGKEFITIQGKTSTTLTMKAFAFEAGAATVTYKWGRTQTGCCMGVAACPGSFTSSVARNAYVTIGSIPTGKKDLYVRLTARADVDVQLYDVGANATATFGADGRAVIAYADCGSLTQGQTCVSAGDCGTLGAGQLCNAGPLGNNEGGQQSVTYEGRRYTYSGYYGDGKAYGNEWVKIDGVINRPLLMKAFGYAAGPFTVEYNYYEDVPAGERPSVPS
eukprot:4830794-Prymnesium_polylepis.1